MRIEQIYNPELTTEEWENLADIFRIDGMRMFELQECSEIRDIIAERIENNSNECAYTLTPTAINHLRTILQKMQIIPRNEYIWFKYPPETST